MDETQKRIDALLERVRKTLPMDPWTLARVREPLKELVDQWYGGLNRYDKYNLSDGRFCCAMELEGVLEQWEKEAEGVSEQMEQELHAGHAADDHEADDEEDDLEF